MVDPKGPKTPEQHPKQAQGGEQAEGGATAALPPEASPAPEALPKAPGPPSAPDEFSEFSESLPPEVEVSPQAPAPAAPPAVDDFSSFSEPAAPSGPSPTAPAVPAADGEIATAEPGTPALPPEVEKAPDVPADLGALREDVPSAVDDFSGFSEPVAAPPVGTATPEGASDEEWGSEEFTEQGSSVPVQSDPSEPEVAPSKLNAGPGAEDEADEWGAGEFAVGESAPAPPAEGATDKWTTDEFAATEPPTLAGADEWTAEDSSAKQEISPSWSKTQPAGSPSEASAPPAPPDAEASSWEPGEFAKETPPQEPTSSPPAPAEGAEPVGGAEGEALSLPPESKPIAPEGSGEAAASDETTIDEDEESWGTEEFEPEPPPPATALEALDHSEATVDAVAEEDDWGDVVAETTGAAAPEATRASEPAPPGPEGSPGEDEETWADFESAQPVPPVSPELPLSLGEYAASLDARARADAEAARRAAVERAAREQARPSFQHTGDKAADAQLEILHRELDGRAEGAEQALLLRRIAEVYESKAREIKPEAGRRLRSLAIEALERARQGAGESLPIVRFLRQLREQNGQWEEALAEAGAEGRLLAQAPAAERVEGLLAQGRLASRVRNDERAIESYQQVLSIEPKSLEALRGLDGVYTRSRSWEPLIDVLERQSQLLDRDEEQAQLQYRLGQILSRFLAEREGGDADVTAQVFVNKVIGCFRTAAEKSANPVPPLAALRGVYARFGKWAEFIEVSQRLIDRVDQPAAKIYLLYHNGRTHLEKFNNPSAALPCFERILEIDPAHLLTLKALEKIHVECDDNRRLADVLQRQVALLEDPRLKALLSLKIGRLFDEVFDEDGEAVEWYSRALEVDPRNRYVLQALGKLHARNKDWRRLAQIFEYEAEAADDGKQKIDFLLKRAEVLVNHFDDIDGAIEILFGALQLDDTNLAIYRELGRLLAQRKRWPELIRLYEAEATLSEDPHRLIAIYMSLGELWQEEFDAPEGTDQRAQAIACYHRALEIDPSHTPALRSLGKLFAQHQEWEKLSEVYSLEVEQAASPATQVDLYIKMAEVEEDRNKNDERAVFFLRKALELDPHNKMVLSALARLTPRLSQWDDLLQAYVRDAETSEDLAYVAALHQLIGQLWQERFGFPEKAQESFRRAASLQSGNIVALRSLEENLEGAGQWEQLCEALLDDLSETSEPAQKVVLLKRLAEVTEDRLENPEEALGYYEQLLEIEPANFDALEQSARLCGTLERWEQRARALKGLLGTSEDPAYRAQLNLALAELVAEQPEVLADEQDRAIESLRSLLEAEPKSRRVLDLLAEFLHRGARWDELAETLSQRVALGGDDAELAAHYRRLGQALLEGSSPGEQAIEAFRQAIGIEPDDLSTRIELSRACEKAGQYEQAAEQLRALQGVLHDPERRRALSVELARILHERLDRHDEAIATLRGVLDEELDHPEALAALGRIAADQENWDEAIGLAERRYALAPDDGARRSTLLELASLWRERKHDLGKAAECCSKVLATDANCLDALSQLCDIENELGRAEACCALGEREIAALEAEDDLEDNASRLHALHTRLAEWYREPLGERPRAREHLCKALEIRPDNFESMRKLEGLYEDDLMWQELAGAYAYRAERTEEADEKFNLFIEAAHTWRDRSQATEAGRQAIAQYEQALRVHAGNPTALLELAALAEKIAEYDRAAKTFEALAEVLPEGERPDPLARAGRLYERELGDVERARDLYGEALEIDPVYLPAAEPLGQLYYEEKNWRLALPLYERLAEHALPGYGPDGQARFHFQYGGVLENLGQDEQAVASYTRSREIKPHYLDPIDALVGLHRRRRSWAECAAALNLKLEALAASNREDESYLVYQALGEVQQALGEPQQALESYRTAAQAHPDSADAHEAAARLARQLGELEAAAESYRRGAEAALKAGAAEQAAGDYFAQGEILLEELGRSQEAAAAFESALSAHIEHPEALDRMARAHYRAGSYETARQGFEKLLARGGESKYLADYHNHLGRIALEASGDSEGAIAQFEKALEADPLHRATFESLGELYEKAEQWEQAAETYQKFIELVQKEAPREAAPLHNKLGDLYKDRLGKSQEALLEFRKAARLDPGNDHPHVQLAELFEASAETTAEAVREHAALLALNPFRWESYHRLFSIYEGRGGHDKAFCLATVLSLTGQASESEQLFVDAQQARNPKVPKAAFGAEESVGKFLWHPFCRHGAAEMLQVMGYALGRLAPVGIEKFSVGKGDRIAADDASPARQLVGRVLAFLGGRPCDLYWCRKQPRQISVLLQPKQAAVLVGSQVIEAAASEAGRAFLVSRGLWPLADGSFALLAFEPAHYPRLVSLMGRALDEGFKMGGDPDAIKRETKLILKELSRKQRKEAEPLLGKLRQTAGNVDMDAWRRGIAFTADRFGLLFCNNLQAALDQVIVRGGEAFRGVSCESVSDWPGTFAGYPPVGELLRFATSEEYFALRTKLGLSILST